MWSQNVMFLFGTLTHSTAPTTQIGLSASMRVPDRSPPNGARTCRLPNRFIIT
jgi:hypothetical protein